MIELEKRPIEWLYYKIKTMDDYDMRKLLSEELLKREVNNADENFILRLF